jgi:cyanophycinase-like exopeptidase
LLITTDHIPAAISHKSSRVEADGHSRVVGKNSAYFTTLDHRPVVCVHGKPLTLRQVKVLKLGAGAERGRLLAEQL